MVKTRAIKRSASTIQGDPDITLPTNYAHRVPLMIGDTNRVLVYYKSTLDYFRQRNCSVIIRAAIKIIEPQKRVDHPYTGRNTTRPDWWPWNITHKHPEHMRKEDRIELFIHILYNLGRNGLTADSLEEIATDAKQDLRDPEDVNIIYEVLRVRKMEEQFERGEIGANTVIYLEGFRAEGNKEYGSANAASAVTEAPRDQEIEQDLAPASFYTTTKSSSTLDTLVTFTFQARDGCSAVTDTSPYQNIDDSRTALYDMDYHIPISQESDLVFIGRNGLPVNKRVVYLGFSDTDKDLNTVLRTNMARKESFAGQSSILEPMKISSLLIDPPVCTSKSTVLPGSTQQLSDLSNQNSHFSKHNSRSHKYNDEELWFIWYQHVVLDHKWENILESFNRQFPGRQRPRGKTLQSVYFRLTQRLESLIGENASTESIIHHAKLSYPWMSNQVQSSHISSKTSFKRRRKYEDEEIWFIWWERVALQKPWFDILKSFNRKFPNGQSVSTRGIWSKLNREVKKKKLPHPCLIEAEAGSSHLDKVTSFITRKKLPYPWLLEALETA
ncbi:unnamed protein product [Penicillium viridicatum]